MLFRKFQAIPLGNPRYIFRETLFLCSRYKSHFNYFLHCCWIRTSPEFLIKNLSSKPKITCKAVVGQTSCQAVLISALRVCKIHANTSERKLWGFCFRGVGCYEYCHKHIFTLKRRALFESLLTINFTEVVEYSLISNWNVLETLYKGIL